VAVKRAPFLRADLTPDEKFITIAHSGISSRTGNKIERMRDNAKDFDEAHYGMVLIFMFDDAEARKYGFICAEEMAIGLELLIAEAEDTFSCTQDAGIPNNFVNKQTYEKVLTFLESAKSCTTASWRSCLRRSLFKLDLSQQFTPVLSNRNLNQFCQAAI